MATLAEIKNRRHAYYLANKGKWKEYRNRIPKEQWREYGKRYREKDPGRSRDKTRKYREKYPDRNRESNLKSKERNRAAIRLQNREFYRRNIDKMRARALEYKRAHPEKIREYERNHPEIYALRHAVSHMLESAQAKKTAKCRQYVGCSPKELRDYIESLFVSGMTWENYGEWHVDHIRPLATFDFTLAENMFIASHYSNLQPLWAMDNLSKGSKYEAQ